MRRTLGLLREKQALLAECEVLRERAMKDGLTGLLNRTAFFETLGRELARASRQNRSLALIMVDLDYFKKVNDTCGHLAGDAVLKESARRSQGSVRPYDTVGRYGGEEIVILLPGCGQEEAVQRAEQIRRNMAKQPFALSTGEVYVTCSLGVCATGGSETTPEELVQASDQALYSAKKNGRNRVAVYTRRGCLPQCPENVTTRPGSEHGSLQYPGDLATANAREETGITDVPFAISF